MTILNSKFDVLRGWTPGGDAAIDESLPPFVSGGSPVQLAAGTIVELKSDGTVDVPAASDASAKPLYIVAEGNDDFSADYVGKVLCLRGKLQVRTDKFAAAQTFTVGTGVGVNTSGLLIDVGATLRVGHVLADDRTTNGTIDVELDL